PPRPARRPARRRRRPAAAPNPPPGRARQPPTAIPESSWDLHNSPTPRSGLRHPGPGTYVNPDLRCCHCGAGGSEQVFPGSSPLRIRSAYLTVSFWPGERVTGVLTPTPLSNGADVTGPRTAAIAVRGSGCAVSSLAWQHRKLPPSSLVTAL